MGAVTYIDENKRMRTFPFKNLKEHGCSKAIHSRLEFAKKMVMKLTRLRLDPNHCCKDHGNPTAVTTAVPTAAKASIK